MFLVVKYRHFWADQTPQLSPFKVLVGGCTTKTFVFQLPVNGETRARQQPASYSAGQKRQFGMLLDIRSACYLQAGVMLFCAQTRHQHVLHGLNK